mmetsp:Transcript_6386/g.9350  ORF Transcript_6386/g.9350 Transcript_6386/m.9350 type:complete len:247 (+) Transcript_6386:323-1063(+)
MSIRYDFRTTSMKDLLLPQVGGGSGCWVGSCPADCDLSSVFSREAASLTSPFTSGSASFCNVFSASLSTIFAGDFVSIFSTLLDASIFVSIEGLPKGLSLDGVGVPVNAPTEMIGDSLSPKSSEALTLSAFTCSVNPASSSLVLSRVGVSGALFFCRRASAYPENPALLVFSVPAESFSERAGKLFVSKVTSSFRRSLNVFFLDLSFLRFIFFPPPAPEESYISFCDLFLGILLLLLSLFANSPSV